MVLLNINDIKDNCFEQLVEIIIQTFYITKNKNERTQSAFY